MEAELGRAKSSLFEREAKMFEAETVLIQSGLLSRCEAHDIVYDNLSGGEIDDLRRIAEASMEGNIEENAEILKEKIDETGEECYICTKNALSD